MLCEYYFANEGAMSGVPVGLIFKILARAAAIIRNYRALTHREDWSFVVVSDSKNGSQLFTSGCVLSSSWLKLEVIIDGYQVDSPCTTHGKFKIKIWDIERINEAKR